MTAWRRTVLVVCLLLAVSTGCTGGSQTGRATGEQAGAAASSRVDVDTPALRSVKADAGIAGCPTQPAGKRADDGLPDVTLSCLGGGRDVSLSRVRGPAVVNLFAQWCKPCRDELPHYQELHEKAGGKVAVLGVDYLDTQPKAALELARQAGVTYPLLADPEGRLEDDLRVRGLPGVAFVDADGRLVGVEYRVIRSYAELRDLVRDRLGVRLPA